MADEFIVKRSSARKIGFDKLAYMNATGEIPRFADGGIVGALSGAWDWTRDTVSGAVSTGIDWAKTGVDLLANPGKIWDKLMKPLLDGIRGHLDVGQFGAMLAKVPAKMIGGLRDKIVNAASSVFSGGGAGGGTASLGNGQWARPVNAPFGTRFGVAGSMWSSGHHTGLDFPAATGTPAHAVDVGQVISAVSGGPYGNHIEISHGGGLSSLYAHLSRIGASVGQAVTRGQTIGAVGATGNVTGPHLHLEARQNGRAIDPMPFLYDDGGYLPPGLSLVANGTGKPEPVFTSQQWDTLRAARTSAQAPNATVESHTYLGTDEITDILDRRIVVREQQTATDINSGRYI